VLVERYAPRCTGSLELLNCAGRSAVQHRVAIVDSRENQAACKRLCLSPESLDGVCGGSHARGNCTIAIRLTRGYRKSGDDRECRRELSSNLPPASRHPRRILTTKMTALSAKAFHGRFSVLLWLN